MTSPHNHIPTEYEKENASNCYLMSVMAFMAGLPLPIVNLVASFLFYIGNRRSTLYVKWHCTQALLSQLTIFVVNTIAFGWTMSVLFGKQIATDNYFGYLAAVVIINIVEVIVNMIAAVRVRKGAHVRWWFWGSLTDMVLNTGGRAI